MQKQELSTPSLILELSRFDANLALMARRASAAGKLLRPHAKTHKCSSIAVRQLAAGNCAGIAAATMTEALGLAKAGIESILVTSPVIGSDKINTLLRCQSLCRECIVVLDNYDNAIELQAKAAENNIVLPVLLDLDPEMGRSGVAFQQAGTLAKAIAALPQLSLLGIQCYAGHLQHLANAKLRRSESLRLLGEAAAIFRALRAEHAQLRIFSGSGTGTAAFDLQIEELSELQVGSYCLLDSEYAALETRQQLGFNDFSAAISLMSSVVSNNQSGHVTVDAGLKALYYTPDSPPLVVQNAKILPGWRYDWFGDEHGKLYYDGKKPTLGSRIELSLPHCDPSINLHEYIYVTQEGQVVDKWHIDLKNR
ncbi:MAG: alanine racemase [Lentisphaeria bacterium]|jgi:D-serine deaminase-like pyridoxal phosphate-dependent protein|nr:alanine racemase [Lentisphaeria bacterium]MDY0177039.1 alanine racemase [Lentisphaeria bacterium]NLZ59286.1 DSD1 family PLP-dependent enzyme [Lentisphaerota bacterium]